MRLRPIPGRLPTENSVSIVLSALIGAVSFAGSMVAFGKLQDLISGPVRSCTRGRRSETSHCWRRWWGSGSRSSPASRTQWLFVVLIAGSLLFGVLFVLPIGGADMPVVISMLNAATGVAASATGFVLHQNVLIVSGMLVGASGTLLTLMMARAMGRSVS